ncbi:hypothetical protein DAPPUDRAFT_242789 [Daphnia pulex]|uniref:Uncharacterized protein n=1 Tax=Daphnia pulex TaxID=6669 RepID=E9GHE6_DAPPU|nr:hypothetical protein DAPPUDRAFT_242789 [Daphnia pulex]|eukprot:EFX81179.1 hypothetical protein DAPPUDRAFT_242789 [Daphnia pulex]
MTLCGLFPNTLTLQDVLRTKPLLVQILNEGPVVNAVAIGAWEKSNISAMRIIHLSILEKSRTLMSCNLAQETWSRMETTYSETADEIAPLLWSKFYGS